MHNHRGEVEKHGAIGVIGFSTMAALSEKVTAESAPLLAASLTIAEKLTRHDALEKENATAQAALQRLNNLIATGNGPY